jgi:hypothetical protein
VGRGESEGRARGGGKTESGTKREREMLGKKEASFDFYVPAVSELIACMQFLNRLRKKRY